MVNALPVTRAAIPVQDLGITAVYYVQLITTIPLEFVVEHAQLGWQLSYQQDHAAVHPHVSHVIPAISPIAQLAWI